MPCFPVIFIRFHVFSKFILILILLFDLKIIGRLTAMCMWKLARDRNGNLVIYACRYLFNEKYNYFIKYEIEKKLLLIPHKFSDFI